METKTVYLGLLPLSFLIIPIALSQTTVPTKSVVNPVYIAWSKAKVGDKLTFKGQMESHGDKIEFSEVLELKEVGSDLVKVEVQVDNGGGMTHTDKADILAKVSSEDVVDCGMEKAAVLGKQLECKVYKVNLAVALGGTRDDSTAMIYLCGDIRGGVAKIVIHRTGRKDVTFNLTSYVSALDSSVVR